MRVTDIQFINSAGKADETEFDAVSLEEIADIWYQFSLENDIPVENTNPWYHFAECLDNGTIFGMNQKEVPA